MERRERVTIPCSSLCSGVERFVHHSSEKESTKKQQNNQRNGSFFVSYADWLIKREQGPLSRLSVRLWFRPFIAREREEEERKTETERQYSPSFFVNQFHKFASFFPDRLPYGQHPAGTSDMKSNSFCPSQSSGSSLARSKPSSTTSDISTSSSTASTSMSPPPPPTLWLPTPSPTPILPTPPPRPAVGPSSWFPVPSGEVPKPL